MTHLALTPAVLAAAYDYLCTTPPFAGWNLPDSEDVKFRVVKSRKVFAQYVWEVYGGEGKHTIEVSSGTVGHTDTLMQTMAHELTHMHLRLTGMESRSDSSTVHNGAFRKLAAVVCRTHGWDLKAFY